MWSWTERLFLCCSVAGLGAWAWSTVGGAIYRDYQDYSFEQSLHHAQAAPWDYIRKELRYRENSVRSALGLPVRKSEDGERTAELRRKSDLSLVGRLEIPRLKIRSVVREGVNEGVLGLTLGHIPGTSLPGRRGNCGVAGHRDTTFRKLKDIDVGDTIVVQTARGKFEYRVTSTSVVKPQQVSVLNDGRYSELTLVTCFPFQYIGSAPERFIVKARLVGSDESPPSPKMGVSRASL